VTARDVVLAMSLANLGLGPVWARLLAMDPAHGRALIAPTVAVVLNLAALTLLLAVALACAARFPPSPLAAAVRWLPAAVIVIVLNGVRLHQRGEGATLETLTMRFGVPASTVAGGIAALAAAVALVRWRRGIVRWTTFAVMLVAPLAPVTLATLAWGCGPTPSRPTCSRARQSP
jgi:hypothetical protein